MRPILSLALAAGLTALLASAAPAAETTRRVAFEKGATSAKVSGSLQGGGVTSYRVSASAGQTLQASLQADDDKCHMKLFAPGEPEAIFDGSTGGRQFAGQLSASGDYTAQVFKIRDPARPKALCRYAVSFEVTGEPGAPLAEPVDAPDQEADGP